METYERFRLYFSQTYVRQGEDPPKTREDLTYVLTLVNTWTGDGCQPKKRFFRELRAEVTTPISFQTDCVDANQQGRQGYPHTLV